MLIKICKDDKTIWDFYKFLTLVKNFLGSVQNMSQFKLGFNLPVLENVEQVTYPNNWINLPTITPPHYFLLLLKINHSLVHSFKCWRQSRLVSLARRHTRQQLAETKGNVEMDTKAERKPDGIYQGRGRALEVTGKVGYAKHQEKKFQNKTGRGQLLKQNKEEVEKISTKWSLVWVSAVPVID